MKKTKQLRRSNDKMLLGVLGGFAEYFGWNASLLRGLYVGLMIVSNLPMWHFPKLGFGTGFALYIIAAVIMPRPARKNPSAFESFRQFRGEGEPSPSGRKEIKAVEIDAKEDD